MKLATRSLFTRWRRPLFRTRGAWLSGLALVLGVAALHAAPSKTAAKSDTVKPANVSGRTAVAPAPRVAPGKSTLAGAKVILPVKPAEVLWGARHGLSPTEYQTAFDQFAAQGYRLRQVSGSVQGGDVKYAALWEKVDGPEWVARHGLSSDDYQKAFDDYGKQGFRLVYVDGFEVGGKDQYAAIWEKSSSSTPWAARHGLSAEDYQKAFDDYTKQGFRLLHVDGYSKGGKARFAAIFEKSSGPVWVARHGLSGKDYQKAFEEYAAQGYRLKEVSGYRAGGADAYAAIWEKSGSLPWVGRHGVALGFYQNDFDNHVYQSYRPRYINSFTSGSGTAFNTVWENPVFSAADLALITSKAQGYLDKYGYPGVSFAIAKDGKLIYAAGFGLADKSTGEGVGPDSRFRIASVSKPITSAAAMRLVEAGQLDLDRKVFGANGYLSEYTLPDSEPELKNIKVRQLLQHVAGFSKAKLPNGDRADPMFSNTQLNHKQLIQWALNNDVLAREPGKTYEYSNFGFCLMGRIIEKVTSKTYEKAVTDLLLAPSKADGMVLAANTKAAKKRNEVVYYPDDAYSLNVTRFDAHGGWIATPSDLLRVLVRVDGLNTKSDLINGDNFKTMTTAANINDADGNNPNYAFGWGVGGGSQSHNGSMTGTLGQMVRWKDGWSYAAVVNQRSDADKWANNLSAMVQEVIGGVNNWPSKDLF